MRDIKAMLPEEIAAALAEMGQPKYRAKQIFQWLARGVTSFDEMTNLSKDLRAALSERFFISKLEMLRKQGIQQKELAERIGITEAAMSRYIAGTREPKPDVIANMAIALHTTSDYLLGIENDAFNYHQVRRMIARNASSMTDQEKKALIDALFGEE